MPLIVRNRYAIAYSANIEKPRTEKQREAEKNLVHGEVSGLVTKHVRKRILANGEKLVNLAQAIGRPLCFITLTLPSSQKHSDKDLNRIALYPLIDYLKECGAVNYLWRAEAQTSGQIHWHIITDAYISNAEQGNRIAGKLTQEWNKILDRLGYIKPYTEKQIQKYKAQLLTPSQIEYGKANNWQQPNSCDVQALQNTDKAAAYVAKYVGKLDENKRPLTCRLWGCNDKLRAVPLFTITEYTAERDIMYSISQASMEGKIKTRFILQSGEAVDVPPQFENEILATLYVYKKATISEIMGVHFSENYYQYWKLWGDFCYIGTHERDKYHTYSGYLASGVLLE